jgi:hypothetical protein
MYFRFGSALVLVVMISLAGIALEKANLELRRSVTRQRYRRDVLHDAHIRMRLETQRLGAPAQTLDAIEQGALKVKSRRERTAVNGEPQGG